MISLTSPVRTWAHSWPAGAKLAGLSILTVGLFSVQTLSGQLGAFVSCLILYALPGQVFARSGLQRLRALWPFIVVIVAWHGLTGTLTDGGVIALRLLSAVGFANLVTMTTRLSDMVDVLHWLTTPLRWFGFKPRALEMAIALAVRFTPTLAEKGNLLTQSWRARSARRANWRVIMPFTVLAIDDAEHVAEALKARGGV